MKIVDDTSPGKSGYMSYTGFKSHTLMDVGYLLIYDRSSELSFVIDYFSWEVVIKNRFGPLMHNFIVLKLGNKDEVYIDYDNNKIFMRKEKLIKPATVVQRYIGYAYHTGDLTVDNKTYSNMEYVDARRI